VSPELPGLRIELLASTHSSTFCFSLSAILFPRYLE